MLPSELYRAGQVRQFDAVAINDFGIPGTELMERAGRCTYRALRARWPSARRVAVVCGPGNNGGDGFVVARLAAEDGLAVEIVLVGSVGKIGSDAHAMLERLRPLGCQFGRFRGGVLNGLDVVVDALLGTGLGREVSGEWAEAVDAINKSGAAVVSVDIPSGLDADTGRVLGVAVCSNLTATFIGLKRGLFTGAGPDYCGEIVFDDLQVPPTVFGYQNPSARRIDSQFLHRLPVRSRTAHKGNFGHVLVLGGDDGFAGAARLAAEGAARAGAGLVSVGTRANHAGFLNSTCPELMVRSAESAKEVSTLASRVTVVALGPGLGTGVWGREIYAAAESLDLPLVLDADGLNLLSLQTRNVALGRPTRILTPHPAEAGRLLGVETSVVQRDRFAAALDIAVRYSGICVLKGAGTIIARGDGRIAVCTAGNPGLATGGSGDVLTGVIAAFLAQGHESYEAACLGVVAHATAADRAALLGQRGMLASDVLANLRSVVNPRQ